MTSLDLVQGTPEWIAARVGSLGASRVAEALARTKAGYAATRANLLSELVVERLTGQPAEHFVTPAMAWGTEKEPEARAAYAFRFDRDVDLVGLVPHPTISGTHASPDGLIADDGLIEIKCPSTATHIETLLGGQIPGKYVTQIEWQMACTGRSWCDFASFDPRLPEEMRLFVKRFDRDDKRIAEMEEQVREFLFELDTTVRRLSERYSLRAAA